jgi:hypothetical protein
MYGAVIYDDDTRPSTGWASVRGKQAFRIRGTGDLASDIYWWTNLSQATFMRYGGFNQLRLKRLDYLRPNMSQLHQELGLLVVRMPAARIAEITSEIFDRVMRLAASKYGLERPSENSLIEDLYAILVKEDKPITPEIDEALKQAHQPFVTCENPMPMGSKMITFRRPRIQHCQDVLSTPVPGDQWEFIEEKRMPPENKRIDWLLGQARPALAKVSIKRVEHEVAQVIAYGGGADKERSWMSHPELLVMSKFAKIKIEAAFVGQDYAPQTVYHPLYTGGAIGLLSVSTGILAENYWIALASSRSYRRFSKERVTIFSPRAVWYSASDRFYMLMPALMMHGSGFCVRGYGRGMVTLALQRGALMEARACASAAGLLAPLFVNEEISIQTALAS